MVTRYLRPGRPMKRSRRNVATPPLGSSQFPHTAEHCDDGSSVPSSPSLPPTLRITVRLGRHSGDGVFVMYGQKWVIGLSGGYDGMMDEEEEEEDVLFVSPTKSRREIVATNITVEMSLSR